MRGYVVTAMAFCIMLMIFSGRGLAASVPAINSIEMSPTVPEVYDSITCSVFASDADGDLQQVRFRWYRNTILIRTQMLTVSGFRVSEHDTLSSSVTREGDQVRCLVDVFDSGGRSTSEDVTVRVKESGANNPPVLQGIPDQEIEIGDEVSIDLFPYAQDIEDPDSALDFNIESQGNTNIVSCFISGGHFLVCDPAEQLGSSSVTVRVTDRGGAWDTDTFVIRVVGGSTFPSNVAPSIDFIDIDPDNPDERDDITCEVRARDDDGNLDNVEFRWYVDGSLERVRVKSVSGFVDNAEDTLDSSETRESDDVECRVTVEDHDGEEDTASKAVEVEEESDTCRINVYDLEVEDQEDIIFRIKNTGSSDASVDYRIYVDGDRIETDDVNVDEGDTERVKFRWFGFDEERSYRIRVRAEADCDNGDDDVDEQTVSYRLLEIEECSARYLTTYRCSGNWLQRSYMESDCDVVWKNLEYCSQGCSSGSCIGEPRPEPSGECSFSVESYDFSRSVTSGDYGYASVTIRNTGSDTQEFYADYYLDGVFLGRKTSVLSPYSVATRVWNFMVSGSGAHTASVTVRTECGSSQTVSGAVNPGTGPVYPPGPGVCNYNGVCESGESFTNCPYDCPKVSPVPQGATSVEIKPNSLDVALYKSKVITINIESSKSQDFRISVEGVPEGWLTYEDTVHVDDYGSAFVFINPKERGSFSLVVRVDALTEGSTFAEGVDVFVTGPESPEPGGDWITGAMVSVLTNVYFLVAVIIIAAAVLFWFGYYHLKSEEDAINF